MSDNLKSCNICGTKNSSLHFCDECGLSCCQQCLGQHKSNNVCGLIKEHLSPTNVICMRHKSCYTKFCLKCCLLFCPECADRHSDHNMDLFSIIDAVKKIRRDIPKCVDSLSEKVIDAHKFVTAFPAKMNEFLSLQRQIDVEENVWCTKIKERAEGLCRQIEQQMTELDSDCIIQQQYEQNARETILTLNAVEKVKYSNTFALLWVCIKKKLDQFESNAAKKNILQRLSFQLGVEDHSKLFDMFGSLKYVNIGEDLDLDDGTLELFKKMKIDDQDEDHRRYEKNTEENRKLEADVQRLTCQLHDSTKKSEISLEKKETEIQRLKNQIETSQKEKVKSLEEFIKAQEKSHNEKIVDLQERSHQLQKERDNFEIENKKVSKERDDLQYCSRQTVNDKIHSPGQVARDGNETHTGEISNLQHQLTQLQIERDGILKDYQTVCKERDDIIASRNTLQDEICLKEEMVKANSATKYEELKKLQHQTEKLKTEKDRNLEEYHKVCKERDELKDGAQSIQKVFDEYDNTMRNMTRSLEEKEREHLSKQHTFSNQLKEKDIKISDLNSLLNHQKRLLSEKEENIRVIKKEKDDLQTWQQTLKQQLKEKENTISELNRMHTHHKGIISDHEGAIRVMKREKDDLQTKLSSVAGEKLTKGNPSITDLGDPNRPMKIGEKYGELYDNEWTDAMENIKLVKKYYPDMKDNEIEKIIIRHLQRLLKCCYGECLRKAEDQIHTLGKALAETMCLTFESKEEIQSLPVCKEASVLRRTKSENFAKFLVQNKVLCNNTTDDWDYINKNGNVMQILMESTFFEKCVYLCWCMVIQDPIMYLDDDPIPCTPIDKNTYKEFVKSGDSVAYVVWPALFLHKDGPLLYKGVVQAYWKKDVHDNVEGTEV